VLGPTDQLHKGPPAHRREFGSTTWSRRARSIPENAQREWHVNIKENKNWKPLIESWFGK